MKKLNSILITFLLSFPVEHIVSLDISEEQKQEIFKDFKLVKQIMWPHSDQLTLELDCNANNAGYRKKSENEGGHQLLILYNPYLSQILTRQEQRAIFAHEIGHALQFRDQKYEKLLVKSQNKKKLATFSQNLFSISTGLVIGNLTAAMLHGNLRQFKFKIKFPILSACIAYGLLGIAFSDDRQMEFDADKRAIEAALQQNPEQMLFDSPDLIAALKKIGIFTRKKLYPKTYQYMPILEYILFPYSTHPTHRERSKAIQEIKKNSTKVHN